MSDQYDGQGGSYVINPETGARDLVERTDNAPPIAPPVPPPPPEEPAAPPKPANAGFFSSVTPVTPVDTTTTE